MEVIAVAAVAELLALEARFGVEHGFVHEEDGAVTAGGGGVDEGAGVDLVGAEVGVEVVCVAGADGGERTGTGAGPCAAGPGKGAGGGAEEGIFAGFFGDEGRTGAPAAGGEGVDGVGVFVVVVVVADGGAHLLGVVKAFGGLGGGARFAEGGEEDADEESDDGDDDEELDECEGAFIELHRWP